MSRLQAIVADAQATVALTTTLVLGNIEGRFTDNPELAGLHWVATDNIGSDRADNWQELSPGADTLAFLQYTSGSTGNPKGVMVSHGNLLHNLALIHDVRSWETSCQMTEEEQQKIALAYSEIYNLETKSL